MCAKTYLYLWPTLVKPRVCSDMHQGQYWPTSAPRNMCHLLFKNFFFMCIAANKKVYTLYLCTSPKWRFNLIYPFHSPLPSSPGREEERLED